MKYRGINYVEITRLGRARALNAAALRYDGLKFHEIGERMGGLHIETARQAVLKGQRIIERDYATLSQCAELIARGAIPQFEDRK